jgi:phospholipase/carboxylesterase
VPLARVIAPALLLGAALGVSGCSGCKKTPQQRARSGVRPNSSARAARVPRPPKPPPKNDDGSYSYGGLRYLEYVAGGANGRDKLPLVAAFHGKGQSPAQFIAHFYDFPVAARFIVPYGLKASGKGYEWWDQSPPKDNPAVVPEEKAALDKIAAGLTAISQVRPTLGNKLWVTGFSQGGGASFGMALRHPELVTAACEASGQLPSLMFQGVTKPAVAPEIHGFHGSADTTDPVNESQRTVNLFKKAGWMIDLKVVPGVKHDFAALKDDVVACLKRALKPARGNKN